MNSGLAIMTKIPFQTQMSKLYYILCKHFLVMMPQAELLWAADGFVINWTCFLLIGILFFGHVIWVIEKTADNAK